MSGYKIIKKDTVTNASSWTSGRRYESHWSMLLLNPVFLSMSDVQVLSSFAGIFDVKTFVLIPDSSCLL